MRLLFLLVFSFGSLFSNEDLSFITNYEYGQMLYSNPRGIGCVKCHGENGKGGVIATYQDREKNGQIITKTIIAPDISQKTIDEFKKVLNVKKSESLVMPTYFLTNEEIESIHYYITNKGK